MLVKAILNEDIDQLSFLQPEGWGDIRPYFYYYSASAFCDPIKIVDGKRIIAFGTSIKHQDTAWLAHVIVHPEFRNQGLGKELTKSLVERLDPSTFKTVYLDATDMGYPVYIKSGFEVEMEYVHLSGELLNLNLKNPASVVPFEEKYRTEVLALDKISSGESREMVLKNHLESSLIYLFEGKVHGAYFPGFFDYPIMAQSAEAGRELMKLRMRAKNTSKIPFKNQIGINFLIENGFKEVGRSKRMFLGFRREWKAENNFNRISGGLG